MSARAAVLALAAILAAACAPPIASAETWQPIPLPVPPGGQLATPPGLPTELSFWAPNRGLMQVTGNSSVIPGLYSWDGVAWHQLATVCGPSARGAIAWAGPTEFWTVSAPSPGVASSGALCRFKDGAVVGSYGAPNVPGFRDGGNAAACLSATDCWFGSDQYASVDGSRIGAFHLRWDGSALTPTYAPQGRAVSDLLAHGGQYWESVVVGPRQGDRGTPFLRDPEPAPALLHRIVGDGFANDPWLPAPLSEVPADGSELLALDGDGITAWAVGGAAASGPAGGTVERGPLAARFEDGSWRDLRITSEDVLPEESFGDVAAVPGTRTAWATLTDRSEGRNAQPRVAFIGADGAVTVEQLAGADEPLRGAAAQVACPTATDCWLATTRGYLYRWGGGDYARDDDPAFQGTISERPNEGAGQFLPDSPPDDDSRLFAPPVERPVGRPEPAPTCRRPRPLMSGVRAPKTMRLPGQARAARDPRYRLTIGFRLARRARVSLIAERRAPRRGARRSAVTRVVARTRPVRLGAGRRSLAVTVRRTTWPTRLRFVVSETTRPRCVAAQPSSAGTSR